ncbi:ROK family protein [Brachybacterium hainanense]|uniref:ROK family protein n=1 Tax=Brachybacterium hainanense TaxID=1541174 RepID=A0ABV6RE30_9MICO
MPDPAGRHLLALDIGGSKTSAALVREAADGTAEVLVLRTAPTPAAAGPAAILDRALALALEARGEVEVAAAGVASAGVVDVRRGTITHATDSLRGWAGTDVAGPLAAGLGVDVRVLNDVQAHGLGEARSGAGRGAGSLLLLAVGTGIGGCHVLDGEVVVGARGAAGHMGHVAVPEAADVPCTCGRTGHLEGLASGPGVLALAGRLGARLADGGAVTDGRDLAALALTDPEGPASRAYAIAGRATGRVLGGLLNVLDPELVALTGGVAEADGVSAPGGVWREALAEGMAEQAMDVVAATPVVPARAGQHAALLGAAHQAAASL